MRQDEDDSSVTDHQLNILNHLDCAKGKTLSQLAGHMGVSRSTMSITVSRLIGRGYIAQGRDDRDARCVSLTLTASGARLREQNSVLDPELVRAMLRLVPAGELESSLQGFEQLARCAEVLMRRRKGIR